MSELAINKLVSVTNAWMRYVRIHLEIEDGGRVLASLQGHLAGYKDFLAYLAAEFGLTQYLLEDNNEIETPAIAVEDIDTTDFDRLGLVMDDTELEVMASSIDLLTHDRHWHALEGRVQEKTEELKSYLLFQAVKSRDLDVCQGHRQGMTIYDRVFLAVRNEYEARERRRKEEQEKGKQGAFAFDDEPGDTGQPVGRPDGVPA